MFQNLNNCPSIFPSALKVCSYTGDALPVVGESVQSCVVNSVCYKLKCIIVNLNVQPILSAAACTALNLMQRIDYPVQVSRKCKGNTVNTNFFAIVNSQSNNVNIDSMCYF